MQPIRTVIVCGALLLQLIVMQNCSPGPQASNLASSNSSTNASNGPLLAPPLSPSQLNSQIDASTQVTLSWVDNSSNESGFKIERASDFAGPFTTTLGSFNVLAEAAPNQHIYIDATLTPGTSYRYRVFAINAGGSSSPSNVMGITTPAAPLTAPLSPSSFQAVAVAPTIVNLNWNDNSNNESYFRLERSVNGGAFVQMGVAFAGAINIRDINLLPQNSYVYRIQATNSAGSSAFITSLAAVTPAAGNTNTYSYVNANIIAPNCLDCHNAMYSGGGIRFDNYNSTIGAISKSSSANSKMYQAILARRMPPSGPLTTLQTEQIRIWIDAGSLNN